VPTPAFADHFSAQAEDYARHRPGYPRALFDALDCGCGNGQVARDLAADFEQVVASDPSAAQIAASSAVGGVHFLQAGAAPTPLATASCDLVTVGQALHWFAHDAFFNEVHRVLRPGGVLAAWCYSLLRVSPKIDATTRSSTRCAACCARVAYSPRGVTRCCAYHRRSMRCSSASTASAWAPGGPPSARWSTTATGTWRFRSIRCRCRS
jgi:SAM-dependent methyltransferase